MISRIGAGIVCALTMAGIAHAVAPPVAVVDAPGSPVKLDQVKLLNTDARPWVLLIRRDERHDDDSRPIHGHGLRL
ncbi:MAG: hypothetical protein FJW27_18300 [Acidimicrobiia bacterium]|nr:hypothetical protein [Acidimicrobiia bacterium]